MKEELLKKINHIGIAVSSIEEHAPFYRDVLGLEELGMEEVADQKVKVAMFRIGEARIELLEPTSGDSPIARFIEKKGEGFHHIAYETEDIESTLDFLKSREIGLIDEKPRSGAHGTHIAFLHPKSTGRVLTEICRPAEE